MVEMFYQIYDSNLFNSKAMAMCDSFLGEGGGKGLMNLLGIT